uniref:Mac/perforin domain containing membrane protein n=1 Tax=Babesia bovis TaxID=5865 RepID=A7AT92_BABBO|eukprot:XP_001609721.1 mac/perforin domain containing membrane protein [Babesia bovis T2Bo]
MVIFLLIFSIILAKSLLVVLAQTNETLNVSTNDEYSTIKNDISDESNVIFSADRIVSGLEYLGSGYDAVKASGLVSINNGDDLGHRSPIVDFYWAKSDVGVTNSLKWLQPLGGWVRPITACGESETVTVGSQQSTNEESTQFDFGGFAMSSGLGSGALRAGYTDISGKTQHISSKQYTNSYYCFTYAAGMPPYFNWETTSDFDIALNELPKEVKSFDQCTVELYKKKSKKCGSISKWVDFFLQFGTHVTTEIQLGGKIIRLLTIPNNAMDSFLKSGLNVDVAVKAVISGALLEVNEKLNSEQQKAIKELQDDSLLKWKSTVPIFPMPIRTIYAPLDMFIHSSYKEAYRNALNFYIKLNGALPWVVHQHNGTTLNVESIINMSTALVLVNTDDDIVKLDCPHNDKVIFGFILEMEIEQRTFSVYQCPTDAYSCSKERQKKCDIVIWMLCGSSMGLNVMQYAHNFDASNSEKEVKCLSGYKLLTGFIAESSPEKDKSLANLIPCHTGADLCRSNSSLETHIWAVCIDERLPGLGRTSTLCQSDYGEQIVKIGENMPILTGK